MFNIPILQGSKNAVDSVPNAPNSHETFIPNLKPLPSKEELESFRLKPSQVRWFYKDEPTKKWIPFDGFDSLKLESIHRPLTDVTSTECVSSEAQAAIISKAEKPISVRNGLFEVNILDRTCTPVYWDGKTIQI